MNEPEISSLIRRLDDLTTLSENNAEQIARVMETVKAHSDLDTQQHKMVADKVDEQHHLVLCKVDDFIAEHRQARELDRAERAVIAAKIDALAEVKNAYENAKGFRKVLIGLGALVVAVTAIGAATIELVKWAISLFR